MCFSRVAAKRLCARTRAYQKIMLKTCAVPRYNVKRLDCTDVNGKRKTKDREGNTSITICRVPSKSPMQVRFFYNARIFAACRAK